MPRTERYMRHAVLFGLATTALISTGCASVYHTEVDGGFSDAPIRAAAGLPLQVDGMVGGQQGAPLAQAVAAAMPTSISGATVQYVPCEEYTECPGDHLVWTFGPPAARPASAHPPALSTNLNWIGPYRPAPNNVAVKLALFEGNNVVASTSGQVDASSPSDPAFQALIAAMTQSVLSGPGLLNWIY